MSGASPKRHKVAWVKGSVGVQSRNFSNERICSTGWRARVSTLEGIGRTYPWIEAQVKAARQSMLMPGVLGGQTDSRALQRIAPARWIG